MHPVQVEEGMHPIRGLIQVPQGIVAGAAVPASRDHCDDLLHSDDDDDGFDGAASASQ